MTDETPIRGMDLPTARRSLLLQLQTYRLTSDAICDSDIAAMSDEKVAISCKAIIVQNDNINATIDHIEDLEAQETVGGYKV